MPRLAKGKGYSLDHAHRFFQQKYKGKWSIDRQTYRNICYAFNKMLVEGIINGRVEKLPHSMGELWVKKYKIDYDNPPIDLNESRKAGKVIYHLNFHSDGYQCRWAWSKRNNMVKNLIYYSFKASRANGRAVAQVMKQPKGHKRYFS